MRPFRALTYRDHEPGHLARVSSPAYDLVTAAGRDRLAAEMGVRVHPWTVGRALRRMGWT